MKIIFFGSDEFSIKALEACLHSEVEIAMVVTTPAKKKGRGLHLEPSEVFNYCKLKHIPVTEFSTLKDPKVVETLRALRPDIFVVASYGKLIPTTLLSIPKYRLNVHPSLLPKYRGAAPINWPILNGDTETGVSILDIAEKLDSGDVFQQEKLSIGPSMTAEQLAAQLAALSYSLLKKALLEIKEERLNGTPQDHAKATLARQLEKKDGEFTFSMPAIEIDRKIRGLRPWPGCYFFLNRERIGVLEAELLDTATKESPSTVLAVEKDGGIAIATGKKVLKLLHVKPEGKKAMTGADFAHGRRLQPGMILKEST